MRRIAIMYKLNSRGEVIRERLTDYHSCEWESLTSQGYITHDVLEVGN